MNLEQKSMTALVSAFARWHHAEHNGVKIFDDSLAGAILSGDEKLHIAASMGKGIAFFNPAFSGTEEEALRWIVDNQLAPSPLGRSAWAEKALQAAVSAGAEQYVIIAAGYDTFAYRQPEWAGKLRVFELDSPFMSMDKQKRVREALGDTPRNVSYAPIDLAAEPLSEALRACGMFDERAPSFFSLLGISYYLSKGSFRALIEAIADMEQSSSLIAFDYPDELTYTERAGERAKKQAMMARGTGEAMLAGYARAEMERLLSDFGFGIVEHLTPDEITKLYFGAYNRANPERAITAFDNVNYCLAVKG